MLMVKNAQEARELQASTKIKVVEETITHALNIITDEALCGQSKAEILCLNLATEQVVEHLKQLNFKCLLRSGEYDKYRTIMIYW